MQIKFRADILSAIIAFIISRDIEMTRLAFAVWHLPR